MRIIALVTHVTGRKLGPAEDGDGDGGNPKVKVIGRKVVTGTDLCTLTPQWDKKFVLVVPPRLVYDAAQALHARDSEFMFLVALVAGGAGVGFFELSVLLVINTGRFSSRFGLEPYLGLRSLMNVVL